MDLLIVPNTYGTHADVQTAPASGELPASACWLRPGESHLGIPYEMWREHLSESVDVLELQARAMASRAPRDSSSILRTRQFWLFAVGWAIVMAGIRAVREVIGVVDVGVSALEILYTFGTETALMLPVGFLVAWAVMAFGGATPGGSKNDVVPTPPKI